MSPDSVRKLASDVMESCGGRCAVFNGNDENGYRYIIGEKDGDLREFVKEMNRNYRDGVAENRFSYRVPYRHPERKSKHFLLRKVAYGEDTRI